LSDAGHEILFAENGAAGVELAAGQKLDAAVIDYQLPDMNGDIVAAAIRVTQPNLPIILVSGGFFTSPDTGDSATVIDLFLQKPFTPKALLTAVTEARERRKLCA
jgi:CheY-like chemotaxis protein